MKYVNLTINRILPNLDFIIKIYTKYLFAEGKQRLRYILAIALFDIYITYDI